MCLRAKMAKITIEVTYDGAASSDQDAAEEAREAAAYRTREHVRPEYGRHEGMLTRGGEAIGTSPLRQAVAALERAQQLYEEQQRIIPGQMEQDPEQAGRALETVGSIAGARAPLATSGELGALGGKVR